MSPTDEQLAAAIRERSTSAAHKQSARDACAELYRRHAQFLLAFLASRVHRADLDDTHQEIWERVWRHLPESFTGGNFRAWLYKIAHNRVIDAARKFVPGPLPDDHDAPDPRADAAGDVMLERERMALLQRCLEQLAGRAARLVRARLAGADYETIGKGLGLQPVQAHRLFHSAKGQLQDCINRGQV